MRVSRQARVPYNTADKPTIERNQNVPSSQRFIRYYSRTIRSKYCISASVSPYLSLREAGLEIAPSGTFVVPADTNLSLTPREVEVIRMALRALEDVHKRNGFRTLVMETSDLRSKVADAMLDNAKAIV